VQPVIPALGRLRQEDCKFQASLGYIAGLSLKTTAAEFSSKNDFDAFKKCHVHVSAKAHSCDRADVLLLSTNNVHGTAIDGFAPNVSVEQSDSQHARETCCSVLTRQSLGRG
jgi:hypothetical protein